MFRTFPKGIWSRWAGQPRPKPQHDPHLQTHLGASLANRTATHVLCWWLPVNPGGSAGVKASEVGVMVRQKCPRSQIRGQTMWSSALYLTFNQSSGCLITSCGGAYKHSGLQAWLSWPPLFQQSKFPHIPPLRSAPHPQPITTQSSPLFFIPSDAPSSPSPPHLILFFLFISMTCFGGIHHRPLESLQSDISVWWGSCLVLLGWRRVRLSWG